MSEDSNNRTESLLTYLDGLGLRDVTGTNWTTHSGERKYVASAGEVKAAGLERRYLEVNGQLLVTDDEGRVYLGYAHNPRQQQHLEQNGYRELVDNPKGVNFYVPQVTDSRQV